VKELQGVARWDLVVMLLRFPVDPQGDSCSSPAGLISTLWLSLRLPLPFLVLVLLWCGRFPFTW